MQPATEDKNMNSLKLLDFGFAKHVSGNGYTSSSRGTPQYVAPEVVFKNRKGKIEYGTSCDMWSLGVLIYELMSGTSPFERKRTLPEFFKHVTFHPHRRDLVRCTTSRNSSFKYIILGSKGRNPFSAPILGGRLRRSSRADTWPSRKKSKKTPYC